MPLSLTDIPDQVVALNTPTAALAFTVSRSAIVVPVAALAYANTLLVIDLGTDAAALGIEVGSAISGHGIPAGAVVASIAGNTVNSDLPFTADGDGTPVTFAPPIAAVVVTAVSLDAARIGSVVLGGSGASRTVTVTPATGKSGPATIEITAAVGDDVAVESFLITITPVTASYSVPASWTPQEIGPVQDVDSQGERGTLKYAAPYPACITPADAAYRPAPGVKIAGLPTTMVVGTVKIEPVSADGAGLAMVTVNLIPPEKFEGTDSEGDPVVITYKCHWENEQKPLHTADIYMPTATPPNGKRLSEDDLVDIEYWKQEPDGMLKKLFKYKLEGQAPVTLSANAKHFARKVLRGTETYPFAYPVVTRTGVSRLELAFATTMNKWFNAPPGFPKDKYPKGWLWVGVEDDREQQGRSGPKERGESYRGVTDFDRDFYKPGRS